MNLGSAVVPSKVGEGPVKITGTAGRFHGNPITGWSRVLQAATNQHRQSLKELQWTNVPDAIPTMNHFL